MNMIKKMKLNSLKAKYSAMSKGEVALAAGGLAMAGGATTHMVGNLVVSQMAFNAAAVKAGAVLGTTHAITPAVIAAGQAAAFTGAVATAAHVAMVVGAVVVVGSIVYIVKSDAKKRSEQTKSETSAYAE